MTGCLIFVKNNFGLTLVHSLLGFGESGNGNLSFLGDRGNENLFLGFGSGFGVISGSILFQI